MNRFLKGRRAAPWAWMQTGPLTVDVEARLSNNDRECERIPASIHTEATCAERVNQEQVPASDRPLPCTDSALLPERAAETTETDVVETAQVDELDAAPEEAAPETEDTKLTLDDFPALKAAMESFEKRGDPILMSIDPEPSLTEPVYTLVAGATLAAEAAEGDLPDRAPKRRRSNANPRKSRSKRIAKRVNLRPAAPRKQRRPKTPVEVDLCHHERHCTICQHPERDAIEEAFCQWRNVKFIAREFNATGGPSAIYRHARALNLFKQRNLTLRSSLEFVIEQSERIIPTAEGLVKAIRAYTRINDAGQWIDTPTTHIVQVIAMPAIDPRNLTNSVPGLTLNVRKHPSDLIESSTSQPLLPGSAPQVENAVTD
jgi:hypothetical protein